MHRCFYEGGHRLVLDRFQLILSAPERCQTKQLSTSFPVLIGGNTSENLRRLNFLNKLLSFHIHVFCGAFIGGILTFWIVSWFGNSETSVMVNGWRTSMSMERDVKVILISDQPIRFPPAPYASRHHIRLRWKEFDWLTVAVKNEKRKIVFF